MRNRRLKNLPSFLLGVSFLVQAFLTPFPVAAGTSNGPLRQPNPCDGSLLDFAGNNKGWVADNYSRTYAKVGVRTVDSPYSPEGGPSVLLNLDMEGVNNSSQFYVDLSRTKPECAQYLITSTPWWESGSILSLWVWAPGGVRGNPEHPNGLHLYAVDDQDRTLYGTWQTFQENTWFEVTLRLGGGNPACGELKPEFDFTRIQKIGINIALNKDDPFPIESTIYISPMQIKSGVLIPPGSDHIYSFEDVTEDELPKWRIVTDKAWEAEAFTSSTILNGVGVIDVDFREDATPHRKGVMNLVFAPDLNLRDSNPLQEFLSLDIKFDPPPDFTKAPCPFSLKLWAFDSGRKVQFDSIDQDVGSGEWTRVAFRLGDLLPTTKGADPSDRLDPSRIGKIGFQVYDAEDGYSYTGNILIDNITIGSATSLIKAPPLSFVKTDGSHFTLDGQRFRFVGTNAEYLPYKPDWVVDDVLDRAESLGIRVIRTWGFGEGCEDYNLESCEDLTPYFQPRAGVYNESAFEHFDRIVYEAGRRNIRLIVPLVNNWYEHGGIPRYICWNMQEEDNWDIEKDSNCNVRLMSDELHDTFYTDPRIRGWYEKYVEHFVTHVNTITGIPYAEDPTIMAWELINEPRARSDPSGHTLHQWIVDMSKYLEQYAPNQLIGTGEEGWYIMPKAQADQFQDWQEFEKNYWHYGVNWADSSCMESWGSNGTDFLSDNSSEPRDVEWQMRVDGDISPSQMSEPRGGVPNVDFTGIHLYISPGETGLSYAPYCYYYGLDTLCYSPYDTTNNPDFSAPVHQAREWINQHVKDSHEVLNKPFLLEEFNFPVPMHSPLGIQTNPPNGLFQVTPDERARLFRQYLDMSYRLDVDGVMFWNLGYEGFMQQPWNEIDALKKWTTDFDGSLYTDNSNGLRFSYYPNQNNSMMLSDPQVDWLRAEGNPVLVDLFNTGDAQEVVFEVHFSGDIIPRSKTFQIQPGENKFLLDDLLAPIQKLESEVKCPVPKQEPPLVTKINMTVRKSTTTGNVHVNFYSLFNNKYVIYPGDPIEDVIRAETVRWSQNNPPAESRVKITNCEPQIESKSIIDDVVPIQFSFAGTIEHPDGYYYRYSISAPKGQHELDFGSNRKEPKGQILVHANAIGKYEVNIAVEGERFDIPGLDNPHADSCSFEVINSPAFDITGVQIDDQDIQPSSGIYAPNLSLVNWKREIRVWISDKERVPSGFWVGCQLYNENNVVNEKMFSCQQDLVRTSSTKSLTGFVSGQLPPGQYKLEVWSEDEDAFRSESAVIHFDIPMPLDVYIVPGLLLLAVVIGWIVQTRRKSLKKKPDA